MHDYYILNKKYDSQYCEVNEEANGIEDGYNIPKGIRMGEKFPQNAKFFMYKGNPSFKIADNIQNSLGFLMISSRFKELIERETDDEIEFLPFQLFNQKGRPASDELFYIANIIGSQDCVDMKKSKYMKNHIFPDRIRVMKELHIHKDRIGPACNIFRVRPLPRLIVVRDDLREAINKVGLTGIEWKRMGDPISIL